MVDVTRTIVFSEQLGSSNEIINATFEYCKDFDNDGFDDVKVTLTIAGTSNSGTEDLIGVAFDMVNVDFSKLSISNIFNGMAPDSEAASLISQDAVVNNSLGFNIEGGGVDEPYDVAVRFNNPGAGTGITNPTGSFVLSLQGADLDASSVFDNTDWYVRLQSTNSDTSSAKTGGFVSDVALPPCPDGIIEGYKYLDTNGSAAGGLGAGIKGWTITLKEVGDTDGDGTSGEEYTTLTDADGHYKFEELFYGSYTVTEETRTGWYATTAVTVNATLSATDKEETVNFANTEKGKITGEKYEDTNGPDIAGGLVVKSGWDITLLFDSDNNGSYETTIGTKTTDASGVYAFENLTLGKYQIVEADKVGWTNITPKTINVELTSSGQIYGDDATETTDFVNWQPPPPENGTAQTPGFWKNWGGKFDQETHDAGELPGPYPQPASPPAGSIYFNTVNGYETFFGVQARGATTTSFEQALGAAGGGENAFLRASAAAFANAATYEINYQIDEAQITAFAGTNASGYLNTLNAIDTDDNDHISVVEIKVLVADIYTNGGSWNPTNFTGVAAALDAMNNMVHLDSSVIIA